ncbi:MAG: phosphoribosylformylglycinamidine cyclo-ligase [Gammaproteobacteria bacterium]|nr:phosphoribosylformylglycinamidine cyclo-ligase [Gammaproteobacteria bacterium]
MSLTYKKAGVDIDAGKRLVDRIAPMVRDTQRPEVIPNPGGFGGLFELRQNAYANPVLVAGTDGIGTKLCLAQQLNDHSTVGIDLVAMCANDVVVQGAEPLFFLDYFATGALSVEQAEVVIAGIARGCTQAGAALIGGETAEMPGMYPPGTYDLAGFCVGVVERDKLIDGRRITEGDVVLGLASSGIHSNGYSLVNKIVETSQTSLDEKLGSQTLGTLLLTPTVIYTRLVLQLIEALDVRGLCHVTGGGLMENVPRMIPEGLLARIDTRAWERPEIFDWIQHAGTIKDAEMHRVFNCGMGMLVVVPKDQADAGITMCRQSGQPAEIIGEIMRSDSEDKVRLM